MMTWSGSGLSYLGKLTRRTEEKAAQACRQGDAIPPTSVCLPESDPVFCGLVSCSWHGV